ncbi:hypothetical protein [Micromonospora sp. NPDC050200]
MTLPDVKRTVEAALPGAELMSHAHDDTSDTRYVRDGRCRRLPT